MQRVFKMLIKRNNSSYVLINTSYFKILESGAKRLIKNNRGKYYAIYIEDIKFDISDIYILAEINNVYGMSNIKSFGGKFL